MIEQAAVLRTELQRIVAAQLLATAIVAALFVVWRGGWDETLAAIYGGGTALAASWWFWRGLVNGAAADDGAGVAAGRALYAGAIQRFAFVAAAFAAGIGLFALSPAPLLAAYGGCQLGYLRVGRRGVTE